MEIINGDATKELLEAQAHVWNYTFNYITSMSLKCAVQLGIPDIIYNHVKPITLPELVKALSIPQTRSPYVYRLMRVLVHSGFFAIKKIHEHLEEEEEEGYMLTPSSRLLLKNNETNLSPFLLMITDPVVVTPFHFMSTLFQESETIPIEAAHGMSLWNYCAHHPEFNKIFNDAMACDSKFVMSHVVKDCKSIFEGCQSLLDVGGGTGTVARAISEAFPSMRCTVFDLPHVVSNLKGSCENIEFVAGDMFESIPSADIILLKWILHDWSDEECVKILKKCSEAIPSKDKGGKVIIIDIVIQEDNGKYESTESQLCFDILMMVFLTGKERTETEWKKLILEAGFTNYKITHALGLRSIIEVFP
ncbi:Myricetin o-methyltransferase [Thalictrum thalictroides]|uniref:Myricetin o-methyltransferase n=1 Tax=Thalictrum thalictroides TaxID=46969 RepID=A0A7J6W1G7_THATH|nr:Myricetin o-methyltransferase [Thalictrum thalictroides]